MKFTRQRHKSGCALACFAMLRNCSYNRAREILQFNHKEGVYKETLLPILCVSFKVVEKRKGTKIESLKHNALIVLEYLDTKAKEKVFHAVVWNAETKEIHDPLKKRPTKRTLLYQKQVHEIWELKPR